MKIFVTRTFFLYLVLSVFHATVTAEDVDYHLFSSGTHSISSSDDYKYVEVGTGTSLTINKGASIGNHAKVTETDTNGVLEGKWHDGGVWIEPTNVGENKHKYTYAWDGNLVVNGRSASVYSNGTIANVEIKRGDFDNLAGGHVDAMTIDNASSKVKNQGSIGNMSTGLSDRTGGITMSAGTLENSGYISILKMSGGEVDNFKRISYGEISGGGELYNFDYMAYAKVEDGGYLENMNYMKDGKYTGGGIDRVQLYNGGEVVNNNHIGYLDMFGGTFTQQDPQNRGKSIWVANIHGGDFLGDGRVTEMNLIGNAQLKTSDFTGSIENLNFKLGENGDIPSVLFVIDTIMNESGVLSATDGMINITGHLDIANACFNVVSDIFQEGWLSFDVAGLFNFDGQDAGFYLDGDRIDWKSGKLQGLFDFGDLEYFWKDGTSFIYNANVSSSDDPPMFKGVGLENATTPEPGTLLVMGAAGLFGFPMVRKLRRFRNR